MGVDRDIILFRSVAKTLITQIDLQIKGGHSWMRSYY